MKWEKARSIGDTGDGCELLVSVKDLLATSHADHIDFLAGCKSFLSITALVHFPDKTKPYKVKRMEMSKKNVYFGQRSAGHLYPSVNVDSTDRLTLLSDFHPAFLLLQSFCVTPTASIYRQSKYKCSLSAFLFISVQPN
jgi:hypothetical protein